MKASEMRRSFTVRMQEQSSQPNIGDEADHIVRLRHPWRWVGAGVALLFAAMLVHALITQPGFQWRIVSKYLFSHLILEGVLVTIELTATAMIVGISLGLLMAVMRLSHNPVFSYFARLYISVFRAVPALVQMIFWFNMAALIPVLSLGIPFGPSFVSFSATSVFSPFLAATLGLGLAEAAYMAEIFRGGITTVPHGQTDAARSIGLRRGAALRYVVLPQAMKGVIPPTGNEVIGMLKYTSLASVISVTELLQSATLIFNRTFETVPLLIVAALWYLVLTTALTIIQRRIERRFGRGTVQEERGLLSQALKNALARGRRQRLGTAGAA